VAGATLPRSGVNVLTLLIIAGALVYAGIELLTAKRGMEDAKQGS
jgi:hypothetical protein